MTHARDCILRQLAAHQECQAEIRAREPSSRTHTCSFSPTWSPAVMVGALGAALLASIGFLILLVSAVN